MDYIIRVLNENDYHLQYINLLQQLTTVGKISFEDFKSFCQKNHNIYVIEHDNIIIATITLLIEEKIIHEFGKVGHIEDVVIHENYRNRGIGKQMVTFATKLAKDEGCYKVILNCSNKNVVFYENCGYEKKEYEMAKYF